MLDGGSPYYTQYKSKDNRWFTVACLEFKFYKQFIEKLPNWSDKRKANFLKNHQN